MKFTETNLKGAFVIDIEKKGDNRGFFARAFCQNEFKEHGLNPVIAQGNIAVSNHRGTLRGMHFQYPPAAETKLVRCTRGKIIDIIIDLRPESDTFLDHFSVELSEDNYRALYVPERFAHGYQVLEDYTETSYQVGEFYTPSTEGGLPYDDPAFNLFWPIEITELSEKDSNWKPFEEIKEELIQKMSIELNTVHSSVMTNE